MEIFASAAPSEGLLPTERKVGAAALHLLDCKVIHCLILLLTGCHFCVSLAKNVFRVSSLDPAHNQSHTLYVNDIYHKQQWLNCLRTAMAQQQGAPPKVQPGEAATTKRRSSSVSATVCDEETDENCPPVSAPKLRPQTLSKTRLEQKFQGPVKRKETGV